MKNNTGFSIIEIVVSTLLIVIFFGSIFLFFSVQNKNWQIFAKEQTAATLVNESTFYLSSIGFENIDPGTYGMFYREKTGTGVPLFWEYLITEVIPGEQTYEVGEYVNQYGKPVIYIPNKPLGVYKRIIEISESKNLLPTQSIKKVIVSVWHDLCDFQDKPCFQKEFYLFENKQYE